MSISLKNIHIAIIAISAACLLGAYVAEYIFLINPCPLCIYQRFSYLVFIMLGLIGLSGQAAIHKYYVITAIIALIVAGYHAGIERGIFELSGFCKPLVTIRDNISIENFKEMLYSKHIALCNKPALVIFGLSMAEWNLLLNIFLLSILSLPKNSKIVADA